MINTTLIEILRKLKKEEIKRLDDFIKSPYFNKRKILISLFSEIKKYYPEFKNAKLEKESVWKKLYSGKEYNYGIMKNLIYDLTKLTESFLSTDPFEYDENAKFQYLMKNLIDKNLGNIFIYKSKSFDTFHNKTGLFYTNFYKYLTDLNWKKYLLTLLDARYVKEIEPPEIGESMTLDFFVHFCNNIGGIYVWESTGNKKNNNEIVNVISEFIVSDDKMNRILHFLKTKSEKDYRILSIHFDMIKAFHSPFDKSKYLRFKENLFENTGLLSDDSKRLLYGGLSNALDSCKDTVGLNKPAETFEIISRVVSENIFEEENGVVQLSLYHLAIKTAAYRKKPEFIEMLMKKYIPKLTEEQRSNAEKYSIAFLHHANNEFRKSNEYIILVNYDFFPVRYNIRNLQLINTYELNDYDSFIYFQDNYKHFLSRNKSVEADYKSGNMKFIKYIDRLFKLKQLADKFEIEILEAEIQEDNVVNKYWMLDKLNEMKK